MFDNFSNINAGLNLDKFISLTAFY